MDLQVQFFGAWFCNPKVFLFLNGEFAQEQKNKLVPIKSDNYRKVNKVVDLRKPAHVVYANIASTFRLPPMNLLQAGLTEHNKGFQALS